jgi:hypothetical protein
MHQIVVNRSVAAFRRPPRLFLASYDILANSRRHDAIMHNNASSCLHPRSFHASTSVRFAVRRRRRAGGDVPVADEQRRQSPRKVDGGVPDRSWEFGAEDDDDARVEKPLGIRHESDTDVDRFRQRTAELLDKLHAALAPLGPPVNDPFVLVRGEEEGLGPFLLLDLGPVHGQYTLQVDYEQAMVLLSSPLSGQIYYILSASTGEFCGLEDGHSLEGMLVRDLIRQIYGVPQL